MSIVIVALFIVVVVIIVCTIAYVSSLTETPTSIHGTRFKGIGLASMLGFPTVNLRLNEKVPCGMYTGSTEFGDVTLIVLQNNAAECHFITYSPDIDYFDSIIIENMKQVPSSPGSIIDIYNRGCKAWF